MQSSAASQALKNCARQRALRRLAALRRVGSPVWAPHPENAPQCAAFDSPADETLFGGAAGGGKSDLLCGLALTRHRRAVIFRRQQQDAKALIDRAGDILGDFGRWSAKDSAYLTDDGRTLEFGHCSRPGAEEAWQGRAHDFYGFDELAQFTERQYLFLISWLRTIEPTQRCRVVAASNPPLAAEGRWMIRRWAAWLDKSHPKPAAPGELRWYATLDGKDSEVAGPAPFEFADARGRVETIVPRSRTFVPARLDDNPFYRRSNYRAVLQALPEPLRAALLDGDFAAAIEDDPWQVIPTAWVEAAMARWTERAPGPMSAAGVDVARGGRAQTVIAARHGTWFARPVTIPGAETATGPAAAAAVLRCLRDGAPAQVDVIGVGASCFDHLAAMNVACAAMDARKSSDAKDRSGTLGFVNQRSAWWWALREALDPEAGDGLALPPDSELRADLCAPTWRPGPRGVQVEAKEEIEARLGRSVDKGDAVAMALPQMIEPAAVRAARRAALPKRANSAYAPQSWRR